jgi:hypothetical protein
MNPELSLIEKYQESCAALLAVQLRGETGLFNYKKGITTDTHSA